MEDVSRVLVVEDNPLVSGVVATILRQEAFKVFPVENGEAALKVLESNSVDLILCDVMMPKMDGYAFYEEVRRRAELCHIPFVFLTALDEKSERARGSELGVDDYLVKPFEPEELLAVVKGKLKRAEVNREQYNAYRKRVLHTLSHEFRTPLVAINTGTELLIEQSAKQNADESAKKEIAKTVQLLEAIRRSGTRLERLVTDFIQIQQIDAGVSERMVRDRQSPRTVASIVTTVMNRISGEMREKGFSMGVAGNAGEVNVSVYEPYIVDLLSRIVDNASKFSDTTKDIVIETSHCNQGVLISVNDRGIGLDLAKIEADLAAFQQHGREKREQQGTGLGLVIASKLAKLHGGHLEFANRPDGGAKVGVWLPRHQA